MLFTDNPAGVSGVDAGYSLPIGNQTLWLFGDVFLLHPTSPEKRYVGAVSNCAALVPPGTGRKPLQRYRFLTDATTGLARQVIPVKPGEPGNLRLWPFGSWYDRKHQRVYLYYGRVRVDGTGPLGFESEGTGLAVASTAHPNEITFERIKNGSGSEVWWPSAGPTFGTAVVYKEPFLYVVGGRKLRGMMARVRPEQIEHPSAYEYWSGEPNWTPDISRASSVDGLSNISELSIAYNHYLGGYLAVHSVGITEKVRLSLASEPWGPYRQLGEIGTPMLPGSGGFTYAGKEHPELSEQGGKVIYVTHADSKRYWLHLLKVTLVKD